MKAVTSLRPCCSSLINYGGGGPTKQLANLSCRRLRMWIYHTQKKKKKEKIKQNKKRKNDHSSSSWHVSNSNNIDVPALYKSEDKQKEFMKHDSNTLKPNSEM